MTIVSNKPFYGRYQGTVRNNIDPNRRGRLLVVVPDVLGDNCLVWAESASPLAGENMGMYHVPPQGSGVWVEFQQGDPNYPVWTGGWRGSSSDLPAAAREASPLNPPIVVQAQTQNQIVVSSAPGEGITLETSARSKGPQIVLTATGIKLTSGQGASIELTGRSVRINGSSLTVDG